MKKVLSAILAAALITTLFAACGTEKKRTNLRAWFTRLKTESPSPHTQRARSKTARKSPSTHPCRSVLCQSSSVPRMRSGIPELTEENSDVVKEDATEEENVASIKKWLFSQPLMFEPDSEFVYTNTNFLLLADIVEQVSGKKYVDFLRENFFEPLGMTHTGFIIELGSSPSWAQGNIYKQVDTQPGLTKGAGDLISNAADVTAWINALSSGKVISAEAYKAMTTDYSPEEHYGYGLYLQLDGGVGHYGAIQIYSAFDYVNTDKKQTLVVLSNSVYPPSIAGLAADFLTDLNA